MSWLSNLFHNPEALSLLEFAEGITANLVATNNPKYAPAIQAFTAIAQQEVASISAGNAASPHLGTTPVLVAPAPGAQSVVTPSV